MNHQYARAPEQAAPGLDPAATGLDPSLLRALREQNPLAIDALAGLVDNSLLLSLMSGVAPEPAGDLGGFEATDVGDRERERGIGWVEDDLDRRDGPEETPPTDGSGVHGRLDPTVVDQANHTFWRGVAVTAEGMGLVNASRHMHHYLDNTGAPLDLDLNLLLRDAPDPAGSELAYHKDRATEDALVTLDDTDTTLGGMWDTSTPEMSLDLFYLSKAKSEDWFFAIGGHTAWLTGTCAYVPDNDASGMGTLVFDVSYHLEDFYNWDEGKSVTIGGVLVNDTVLGRLHTVGLAKEYPVAGALAVSFAVRYEGQQAVPDIPGVKLPGDERDGTRTDPDRERT